MNTYTSESINKHETYSIGGREYKVKEYIKMKTETGEQFFVPELDIPMVSDYKWQLNCLKSRLEHPEYYETTENVPEVIERLKAWLSEHTPLSA